MRRYDLICSLGGNCSAAHNLLERGLRHYSLPFDWCYIVDEKPIYKLAECFENDSLFEIAKIENIVPLSEEEEKVVNHPDTLHYKDNFSGYYFVNHFHKSLEDGGYEEFRPKFERRLIRLMSAIESSQNILFILGTTFEFNQDSILYLQNILTQKYPNKNIKFEVIEFDCKSDEIINCNDNLRIRKYKRQINLYDFTKTNYEWAFLDDVYTCEHRIKIPLWKRLYIRFCPIKEFRRELRKIYEV